jgi:hypothetical protein
MSPLLSKLMRGSSLLSGRVVPGGLLAYRYAE